jgi:hypothetical protein
MPRGSNSNEGDWYISPFLSSWTTGGTVAGSEEAKILPAKDSHTRIKPLALASGHGRYITASPERTLTFVRWGMAVTCSRNKFVAVSLPKWLRNGRFTSETAVRWF